MPKKLGGGLFWIFQHQFCRKTPKQLKGVSQPPCCAGAIGQSLRKLELPNPISRSL